MIEIIKMSRGSVVNRCDSFFNMVYKCCSLLSSEQSPPPSRLRMILPELARNNKFTLAFAQV